MTDQTHPTEAAPQSNFLTAGKTLSLIAILLAVGVFSMLLGLRLAVRGSEVEVPSLLGKKLDEVRKVLSAAGLGVEVTGERYEAAAPAGIVISQLPAPGGHVKAKRSVQVVVSLGARRNPVPELIGVSLRSAQLMITQAGYELGRVSVLPDLDSDAERVVQQYPTARSRELGSAKIDVLVRRPVQLRYVTPDLLGQNIAGVTALFENSGVEMAPPHYRTYQNAAKGAVVKQHPEPGYPLSEGDTVSVEVAR